jgi:uncharacterized integral membrane protein
MQLRWVQWRCRVLLLLLLLLLVSPLHLGLHLRLELWRCGVPVAIEF